MTKMISLLIVVSVLAAAFGPAAFAVTTLA